MNLNDYIGEATAYDKKLMLERKDPTSWLKSVSAFANTQGGRLLFGVRSYPTCRLQTLWPLGGREVRRENGRKTILKGAGK